MSDDLQHLRKAELVELAQAASLDASGTRAELIERLKASEVSAPDEVALEPVLGVVFPVSRSGGPIQWSSESDSGFVPVVAEVDDDDDDDDAATTDVSTERDAEEV